MNQDAVALYGWLAERYLQDEDAALKCGDFLSAANAAEMAEVMSDMGFLEARSRS